MNKPRASTSLLLATALSASLVLVAALPVLADAPPGPYANGFETNTSGWFDSTNGWTGTIAREASGYTNGGYASGIPSATGGWHARLTGDPCAAPVAPCVGPNTRWGGYDDTFPIGGYRTYVAIFLDTGWAATHPDARFDFSSSINNAAGTFLRDFVFNAGTNLATDTSAAGFYVGASTNAFRSSTFPQNPCPAPSAPPNTCRAPAHITTSGWYTFRHTFRNDGGFLAVDMDIFSSGGGSVASWTIRPGDAMATVGGNRYGWFANEEIPELPIDDSERSGLNLALSPATASNVVGSSHTVTATVTTTDPDDHPSPGPGVTVEFDVIAGPNTGQTSQPLNSGSCSPSDCTTDTSGQVSWTYTSNGATGTDTIEACFPERSPAVRRIGDDPRTCATVTKTWGSSTGKVTGGGQIQGDPLFAVDGVLLSVPALVPSLAGSGSQASFGFVVQSSGTPKGNLEYQDKPANVRIKAVSITGLFITNVSCGRHAEFSGTAEVTRPTGTTTEDFTVEVDDCGEPGTMDTFGITTETYSNGPSTLIGGNIQIHN
jgi:hypothetical protein